MRAAWMALNEASMPESAPQVASNSGYSLDPSCDDPIARMHATFESGPPNALPGWL